MKALAEVWSSITGNINTRAKDPVIGSFIVAWALCNWDKLALLFFGDEKVQKRIAELVESMAIIDSPSLLYQDLDLILLPLILACIYLFLLPKVSLWVNEKQKDAIIAQHTHAVDLDIAQARKQWELNKEKLRSNPNKEFLAKDVELDLEAEKQRIDRRNKIREYIDQKAKAASELAKKQEAEARLVEQEALLKQKEIEEKERKSIIEKQRLDAQAQIHKATMASHRFPLAYMLMHKLADNLQKEYLTMSLDGLSECIAAIFGYKNFQQLLDDKSFTNENFKQMKYVLADDSLLKRLEDISISEAEHNEDFSTDVVFDHIQDMFEDFSCEFLSEDGLVDAIANYVHEDSYSVLSSDELSGPMVDANTIFEEVELEVKDYNFNEGFNVEFTGSASGHHRKEADVPGRTLDIWLKATCKPVLGKFGLGEIEDYKIGGDISDFS